jgi:hypothetical protein
MEFNINDYEKIIKKDFKWLKKQPHTTERDHIELIIKNSPYFIYFDDECNNIKKIETKDGDIVVLNNILTERKDVEKMKDDLNTIAKIFWKQFKKRIQFFILKPEQTMETLNEEDMEKVGWIRKPK